VILASHDYYVSVKNIFARRPFGWLVKGRDFGTDFTPDFLALLDVRPKICDDDASPIGLTIDVDEPGVESYGMMTPVVLQSIAPFTNHRPADHRTSSMGLQSHPGQFSALLSAFLPNAPSPWSTQRATDPVPTHLVPLRRSPPPPNPTHVTT
jgi:hypothetical protein